MKHITLIQKILSSKSNDDIQSIVNSLDPQKAHKLLSLALEKLEEQLDAHLKEKAYRQANEVLNKEVEIEDHLIMIEKRIQGVAV